MPPLPSKDCVAIRHPGQVPQGGTRAGIQNFASCFFVPDNSVLPKMSDLGAPTTNSGGRKARPYDGQVNPFGRGGVYLRPQRTPREIVPSHS